MARNPDAQVKVVNFDDLAPFLPGGGAGLTDAELRASPVAVDAVDLDVRNLTLPQDSVRQTGRSMTPFAEDRTGPLTDDVLIAGPVRILRLALHVDPALASGNYPLVTIKQGATTVYHDKMEPGLPWSEWCCFDDDPGDVTLSVDVGTLYLNLRYEGI